MYPGLKSNGIVRAEQYATNLIIYVFTLFCFIVFLLFLLSLALSLFLSSFIYLYCYAFLPHQSVIKVFFRPILINRLRYTHTHMAHLLLALRTSTTNHITCECMYERFCIGTKMQHDTNYIFLSFFCSFFVLFSSLHNCKRDLTGAS